MVSQALHSPLCETLKTLTTLETFFSQRPFGLKAQKPPAQGKANNVSRNPGWMTPRTVHDAEGVTAQ